jgi:hypothetical protein
MSKGAVVAKVASKSPLIFSIVAVAGVVGTAVCAVKGYEKHKKLLDDLLAKKMEEKEEELKEKYKDVNPDDEKLVLASMSDVLPENKKERYFEIGKACWTAWIPTAAVGTATIASIILAHKISAAQIAAVSAVATFGSKKLAEQKSAIRRFIGEENYKKLENFITGKKIDTINYEEKDGLCMVHDQFSGETVYMRPEDAQLAINETEEEMARKGHVSFASYCNRLKIGIKGLGYEQIGWSSEKMTEKNGYSWIGLKLEERTSDKGKRYFSISYPNDPSLDFVNVDDDVLDDKELLEETTA